MRETAVLTPVDTTFPPAARPGPPPLRAFAALAALAALTALAALAAPAVVRAAASADVPSARAAEDPRVREALAYLQSLRAAEGRFSQTDARGSRSEGRFYIERPGRARFDYDGPDGLLVVADGDTVSVLDRRLKSLNQYPLEQTPLDLLLGEEIRLGRGIAVDRVETRPGGFLVVLRGTQKGSAGRLELDFASSPLRLAGWVVTDAQGRRTVIRLLSLERRTSLDPALFTAPREGGGSAG